MQSDQGQARKQQSSHGDLQRASDDQIPLASNDSDQTPTQEGISGVTRGSRPTSPSPRLEPQISADVADRVFPVRSVVSIDPTQTPAQRQDGGDGYFGAAVRGHQRRESWPHSPPPQSATSPYDRSRPHEITTSFPSAISDRDQASSTRSNEPNSSSRAPISAHIFGGRGSAKSESDGGRRSLSGNRPPGSAEAGPQQTVQGTSDDAQLITTRFKHIVGEGGHAVITGLAGEQLQHCEDEPIHIPGAVQSFGLLVALHEESPGKLAVRIASENSKALIGYSPRELFALESFCDILADEQADNLLDHIDFIREEDADVVVNGPEVFTMSIRPPGANRGRKLWCAIHVNDSNPGLIICEFELEDDKVNPLVPVGSVTPEMPEDTLNTEPSAEELAESTEVMSKPLRVLRGARKRKGEAAAMEVFNVMSQVQEQLTKPQDLETFLKVLVGVIKELTGFHRVMVYQFDNNWNGRVVTELVDPRATKDLYKGLHFPASDIPAQARELYKINRVRLLYDRDQETARLVCRTTEDLETPLDLTYSYLRAMSPIHIKYLQNMAVRSSMSISINAFNELWGLISCHSYGAKGMRVSFPIRKMCRLVGDSASHNIERLSFAKRLQARKLINTAPTAYNPSGYIVATSEDLLKLFDADYGLLSIRDDTKLLGDIEHPQEALAVLEYLRMRKISSVTTSQDIRQDFPDLRYPPGFNHVAGTLIVPLSPTGSDFLVFFREGHVKEVKWAGNPYEKVFKEGTQAFLEPRRSFRTWTEKVMGTCREWTPEQVETGAVLCLVYGKFIEVWRQKEAVMQNTQLTKLLLANSAHEVRTPLNAIINCLEIALEGKLDDETRDNLTKSYSASKSLIYTVNDLLDLTKTVDGVESIKGDSFDIKATLQEATDPFSSDALRKDLKYEVIEHPGVPPKVIGDPRRVRQAISNLTANAIQFTSTGSVQVEMYVVDIGGSRIEIEIAVGDTGSGMSKKRLDALFRDLEQVEVEGYNVGDQQTSPSKSGKGGDCRTLGLGLAVVARIVRNMGGQLRVKSEEGKGSRFVIQLPFDIPDDTDKDSISTARAARSPAVDGTPENEHEMPGEITLVQKEHSKSASAGDLQRVPSSGSLASNKSLRSFKSANSGGSAQSARSDVDRLIEAIQEPTMTSPQRVNTADRPSSARSSVRAFAGNPGADGLVTSSSSSVVGHARGGGQGPSGSGRTRSFDGSQTMPSPSQVLESANARLRAETTSIQSGGMAIRSSVAPLQAVKIPDDSGTMSETQDRSSSRGKRGSIGGSTSSEPSSHQDSAVASAKGFHVLVAEDDPINSKIIQKRLSHQGHTTKLTVNGHDCASVLKESPASYDAVLMDMQMPMVDGLASTKMIRAFEASQTSIAHLSPRAAPNGRIPIIAVSASLVESEMQKYINAGFDGWILKPISFKRLAELMKGVVDRRSKEDALYQPGKWDIGGWFRIEEGSGAS